MPKEECVRCGMTLEIDDYAVELKLVQFVAGAKSGRPMAKDEQFPDSKERKYIHVDCLAEDDLGVELELFAPGYDYDSDAWGEDQEQMGPT